MPTSRMVYVELCGVFVISQWYWASASQMKLPSVGPGMTSCLLNRNGLEKNNSAYHFRVCTLIWWSVANSAVISNFCSWHIHRLCLTKKHDIGVGEVKVLW